jgi:hypothetical protein
VAKPVLELDQEKGCEQNTSCVKPSEVRKATGSFICKKPPSDVESKVAEFSVLIEVGSEESPERQSMLQTPVPGFWK